MKLLSHFMLFSDYYEDRKEEWDYIMQTIQKAQCDYTNNKCIDCEKKGRKIV